MAYPQTITTFTDPSGTSPVATGPDHAALHTSINDTVEALENVLGTTPASALFNAFGAADKPAKKNNESFGTVNITGGTITGALFTGGTIANTLVGGTANLSGGTVAAALHTGTVNISAGTINNANLGTPAVTGGTANNTTFGTPTLTLGSDATGDMFYRSSAGTVTRLGVGTAGQFIGTDGTSPAWRIGMAARYQFGTTNSTQLNVSEEMGVYWVTGNGTAALFTKDVTFPTAFGTILGVQVTGLGYKDSDPTDVTDFLEGGSSLQMHEPQVSTVTVTGFRVVHLMDAGIALTNNRRVGFFWRAYGIKTT